MFRLLKLAAYGLFAYAIYEFVMGLLHVEDQQYRGSNPGSAGAERSPEAAKMNFSGQGEGQPVSTTGSTGETATHRVGRGVVAK